MAVARRPQPEKLLEIAIRRIAQAVMPTPKRSPTASQCGRCVPIRSARPSMGAFTHLVASALVPPAVLLGSAWVGNADAAAVATAA